jgi:hypothetical protein
MLTFLSAVVVTVFAGCTQDEPSAESGANVKAVEELVRQIENAYGSGGAWCVELNNEDKPDYLGCVELISISDLESSVNTNSPASDSDTNKYMLGVGSFRTMSNAFQIKVHLLSFLRVVARVESVTVNDQQWYMVWIGPIDGAKSTIKLRQVMNNDGIDTIVIKANH